MSLIKDIVQAVARRISGEYPCDCNFRQPTSTMDHAILLATPGVTIEFRDPGKPEVVIAKVVLREMRRSVSEGTTVEFTDYSRWLVESRLANAAQNMAARRDQPLITEVDIADEHYVTPPHVHPNSALDIALRQAHEAQQRYRGINRHLCAGKDECPDWPYCKSRTP